MRTTKESAVNYYFGLGLVIFVIVLLDLLVDLGHLH